MSNQILYFVEIKSSDCHFNLTINDRTVIRFDNAFNINVTIPLNTFLFDGKNRLACNIFSAYGKATPLAPPAQVKIRILQFDQELLSLTTPSFVPAANTAPQMEYFFNQDFKAQVKFESHISKGIEIQNNEQMRKEIYSLYLSFWSNLKSRNISAVMRLLDLKNFECAHLRGISLEEETRELQRDYQYYINDSSLSLWEPSFEKVFLKVEGYNKVAHLELKNGNSPICFVNAPNRVAVYIPIFCYRAPETGLLQIIR